MSELDWPKGCYQQTQSIHAWTKDKENMGINDWPKDCIVNRVSTPGQRTLEIRVSTTGLKTSP